MPKTPLISIIIPTYNRAHIIGETLDSVLSQTYQNWECIVVDDGSTDNTDAVMQKYCNKDSRFKYYYRPDEHLSGGNGARNYGFKKSKGKYIQWFDSDDLMVPEKIEVKVKAMLEHDVDFVVSKTTNFNENDEFFEIKKFSGNKKNTLTLENFIDSKVYWLTYDFFVKRKLVESVKSGQETNFFIKFLDSNTFNAKYINSTLTKRRLHENTIRGNVEVNTKYSNKHKSLSLLDAYFNIYVKENNAILTKLENVILRALYRAHFDVHPQILNKFIYKIGQRRGILQFLNLKCMIFLFKYNKSYNFYKRFHNYD